MKALVVYDSFFGNTEQIARAIGDALAAQADVRTLRVGDVKPEHLADLGLLVVGSPTRAFSASPATKAWLKALAPNSLMKRGGTLVVPPEGFFIKDKEGPLKDGEIERSTAWGRQIAAKV